MKHPKQLLAVLLMAAACTMQAQRSEALLEKNWKFSKGDFKEASQPEFNDTKWESVVIPHDWAIFGRGKSSGFLPDGIRPGRCYVP